MFLTRITGLVTGVFFWGLLPSGAQAQKQQTPETLRKADAAFKAGVAASQAGQLEEARTDFAEAVRLAPGIAAGHAALGSVLVALGQASEAVSELERAAKLNPQNADVEADLGRAYAQKGDAVKALPHFEAAERLAKQPEDAAFHDSYARALDAAGRPAEAL